MRLLILILLAAPLLAQNKTGGALSQPVTNIMNRPITTGVPFMGQVLSFDGTKWVYWTPQTVPLPTDPTSLACGVGCVLDVTPVGPNYTVSPGVLQAATAYYWEVHARSALQFGNWPP